MFERIARELQIVALYKKHNHLKEQNVKNDIENNRLKNRCPPTPPLSDGNNMSKNLYSPPKALLKSKIRNKINDSDGDLLMTAAFGSRSDDEEEEEKYVNPKFKKIEKYSYIKTENKQLNYFVESSYFSHLNGVMLNAEFFKILLDCYLGLSSALMKRADKISTAIRKIEKKHELKFSVFNISQRLGKDIADLVDVEIEGSKVKVDFERL